MDLQCERVAIVGAGLSGLTAIKELKDEGIEPVCFEKSDDVGGTWKYREEDIDGLPSVMWTTIINHSKEFMRSNYLFPKETPNYLRHFELYEKIIERSEELDLMRHIVFNREVTYIKKSTDYEDTGRWLVTVKNTVTENVEVEMFDAVFVCVGHLCYPKFANFPGMENFPGEIMHSHSLKRVEKFQGKKVVVIGSGCSAMDSAVEISRVAKKVYLSMRTPSWILSRLGPFGLPMDYALVRRYMTFFGKILPQRLVSWFLQHYIIDSKSNHSLFGIQPKYPILSRDPIISDELFAKLLTGAVVLRKNIHIFKNEGVIFDGENQVTEADAIVQATGYTWNFDFLEEGTLIIENGRFNLYKCMYPTDLKHPTFALIGFVLPSGPGFPIGELQIRLAVHFLVNKHKFPSEATMIRDAKERHEANKKCYSPSEKISIRVDFQPFCDELATELGAMPNFWKMAFTDPRLCIACIFGASVPYQYRLVGPHKWQDAREAILTSSERMQAPLSADRLNNNKGNMSSGIFSFTNVLIPMMIACLLSWKCEPLSCYFCAFIISYYWINSKNFINYVMVLFLLPFFFSFHGFVAIYIFFTIIFLYYNFSNVLINRHFWV